MLTSDKKTTQLLDSSLVSLLGAAASNVGREFEAAITTGVYLNYILLHKVYVIIQSTDRCEPM